MSAPRLAEVLPTADVLFDRAALEAAIAAMADAIVPEYAGDDTPPLFVTIMHGGMPFAVELAFALGERRLDVEFDYLHVSRYELAHDTRHLIMLGFQRDAVAVGRHLKTLAQHADGFLHRRGFDAQFALARQQP